MRQSLKALRQGAWRVKGSDPVESHVDLLVSILLCYPQILTLDLRPDSGELALSFLVRGRFGARQAQAIRRRLHEALEVFAALTDRPVGRCEIRFEEGEGHTLVEVVRETAHLTHAEISLIVGVCKEIFAADLLLDGEPLAQADDRSAHEARIDHLLADLRTRSFHRHLLGYRAEGRVLVFNRPAQAADAGR